jgi:hypothetical protein
MNGDGFIGGSTLYSIDRDAAGNAMGGIRLPAVEVPIAVHRGAELGSAYDPLADACPTAIDPATVPPVWFVVLGGVHLPFSEEELRVRYPSRDVCVAAVIRAADAAVSADSILPADRDRYVREAAESSMAKSGR